MFVRWTCRFLVTSSISSCSASFGQVPLALIVKKSSVRFLLPTQNVPLAWSVTPKSLAMFAPKKGDTPDEPEDSPMADNWNALLDMFEDGITKRSDIPAPEDWYSDTDPFISIRYFALNEVKDAQIKFFLSINFIKTLNDMHEYLESQKRNEPLPVTTETTKNSNVPVRDSAQRAKAWSAIVKLFRHGSTDKSELPAPETWRLDTDPCIPIRYYARDDVKNAEIEFYLYVNRIKTMQDLRDHTRWF